MKKNASFLLLLLFALQSGMGQLRELPFTWENATVYFVLTDRFENGDTSNDFPYGRQGDGAPLRSFEGGDLQGLINKINEGYFDELGVSALWITPPYENIHGSIGVGVGQNYAFHGYWAKDWTTIDLNLGDEQLFQTFVDTAHDHGIRIVMDVVLNHVGPDNPSDEPWPSDWVRRDPTCNFQGPGGTIPCELVDNLPDIRTESNAAVALPQWLLNKWNNEGRRTEEEAELDAFFNRTGFPRAPRFYIIKWLTDYVRKYGVDGFRVDTVKHVEESVWGELKTEGLIALQEWKANNPTKKIDDRPFWMTGEVFNYFALSMQRTFTGDGFNVDYFNNGYENLINFGFRSDANNGLEGLFSSYNNLQQNQLGEGNSVMNFLANHDTEEVFDRNRTRTFEAGTKLLLSPATAQLYYGDETARTLTPGGGAEGDATLRSFMNFNDLQNPNSVASLTLVHHQRIGKFRREHVAVGGGAHALVQNTPYAFKREYNKNGLNDKVLVYTGNDGDFNNAINLFNLWPDGTVLLDYFSGNTATVSNNTADFNTNFGLVLIGEPFQSVTPQPATSYVLNVKKPQDWNDLNAYFFNKATNSTLSGTADFPGEIPSLLSGSNVWYTYTLNVPAGVDSNDVGIVFNNRNNGSQSVDLMRNREGWFQFTSGGPIRDGFWSDSCPSDCPGTTNPSNTFRVFAQKPGDWGLIFSYTFNSAQNATLGGTPDWPGQEMTKLQGTNAWYFYDITVPQGVDPSEIALVLNNGNNGSQSIDLFRDREGWFNFTSGGSVRSGNCNDSCTFDCPSTNLKAAIALAPEDSVIVFPNPMDGNGSMEMNIKEAKQVRIVIYDLLGREVKTIHDGVMPVGTNRINYELRQSGTYIYNIFVDAEKYTGKLIVN